jgi:hypothetical protein
LPIPHLKLAKLPYPHAPVGVLFDNGRTALSEQPALVEFAKENGFELVAKHGALVVADQRIGAFAREDWLFTGIAFSQGRLVFGADDQPVPEELEEQYGEFSLVRFRGENIEFGTDYFGFGKWYYFFGDTHFAAATSYHLLLLLLKACDLPLEMDVRRSMANLSDTGFGFTFGQTFSRHMDVKNTYVSLPIEKLTFRPKEYQLSRDRLPLYDLVTRHEAWDEDAYEHAILQGREEICSNLRAVLQSEHFDNVVIDLSGGFDSRVVYAAMTTLPLG